MKILKIIIKNLATIENAEIDFAAYISLASVILTVATGKIVSRLLIAVTQAPFSVTHSKFLLSISSVRKGLAPSWMKI